MHKALLAEGLTSVRPAATEAVVTRVRTALEASRGYVFGHGIALQPSLELGLRRDGGDAETGAGAGADDGYTPMPNRPEERPGFGGWPDRPTH